MKKIAMNKVVAPIAFLMLITFAACQSPNQKVSEAQQDVAEAKQDLQEEKNNAENVRIRKETASAWEMLKNDAEAKIKNNEILIEKLHASRRVTTNRADIAYHNSVTALENQNTALRARMQSFDATKNDWESFKREFWLDMDRLGNSLNEFGKK